MFLHFWSFCRFSSNKATFECCGSGQPNCCVVVSYFDAYIDGIYVMEGWGIGVPLLGVTYGSY